MAGRTLSTSWQRFALRGALASLLGVVAGACGSDSTAERLKAAKLAESCSLDSQCVGDLICIFGRCHEACEDDEDCDPGQRCVKGTKETNVCQLDVQNVCERDKDCEGDQICAIDLECRDPCESDGDCVGDQVCVPSGMLRACASTDPSRDTLDANRNLIRRLPDGGTPGSGGGGGASSGGSSGSGGASAPDGSAGGGEPGGSTGSGGQSGTGGDEGSGGQSSTGGGPNITCAGEGLARFRPSNLPQGYVVPAGAPALTHTNANCIFDTDDVVGPPAKGPHFTCAASANITNPSVVTLSDGREAAVLPLESLTIPAGATLKVAGKRPVILAVKGDVAIHGTISTAAGAVTNGVAGGAPWRTAAHLPGLCPIETAAGGGGASRSTDTSGGGGGAFCGKGGNSALPTGTGLPVLGGTPYGTETLVPLVGGSSGGSGDFAPSTGPAGGGAVQIVSGSSIVVSDTGVINMGGWASIESSGSRGGGGGSGGAILLEAPFVTVRGVLAANGAGGSNGYLSHPKSGLPSDQPALGGGDGGGRGAAGDTAAGTDGRNSGGGGGGAGRIRLNAGCGGTVTVTPAAIISPSESTGCYTRGELQ